MGEAKFRACSAGSRPTGKINAFALAESGAALATVVGVLVEVPVMLSVLAIVNQAPAWYSANGAPA